MMDDQDRDFTVAYGEAMFYAHLIEDLLVLHIWDCSSFQVNGYEGQSLNVIRTMSHEKRINELLLIYGEQNKAEGSVTRLIAGLHFLRKIRNNLAHAFIPQVGSDLPGVSSR